MKLSARKSNLYPSLIVCLALCCITIIPYYPIKDYPFINYDDPMYVTENQNVLSGLTLKSVFWSFKAGYAVNWHPLTWISHMVDISLFGTAAGKHHLVNLLIHILNGILLFAVFRFLTGAFWRSALVAALFALHPLHVESVAWISERKDVLSALFFFLTMGCYVWYIRHRSVTRYLLIVFGFIMALMAKPMAVTLPFVLLLLDYWPLNRIRLDEKTTGTVPHWGIALSDLKKLVLEKTPLLLMSIISCVITFIVQQRGGAINSLELIPFKARAINAIMAYCLYIKKTIVPVDLAVFYPFEFKIPWTVGILCLTILTGITVLAIKSARKQPCVLIGWLWFLGMLVPVIGLVQVGSQAMADRYSYLPVIGLFIIAAWGTAELVRKWRDLKGMVFTAWAVIIVILLLLTQRQVAFWKDDMTLFGHAVLVTKNNYLAYTKIGQYFMEKDRTTDAIECYEKSLAINPNYDDANNNLGLALAKFNLLDEAIAHYNEALRINPKSAIANSNLGNALTRKGNFKEAEARFKLALQINPHYAEACNNWGAALAQQGKIDEAIGRFKAALRLNPRYVDAEVNLGMALMLKGKTDEAIALYQDALRKKPGFALAMKELEEALAKKGK